MIKALFLKSATSPLMIKYVQLNEDDRVVIVDEVTHELNSEFKASTELFNLIDELLVRNQVGYHELDRIYIASGPGSYTGARLLVTIVKTIVFMYPEITVFDASILDILLQASMNKNHQNLNNYALSYARKNKYYVAISEGEKRLQDSLKTQDEIAEIIIKNIPCFVNGIKIENDFTFTDLNQELGIRDWLIVSKKVSDIIVYEPYYLEEVNIG